MGNAERIQCIYCLLVKPRPKTGEHIILDGLGGRSTTRDVCDECNQRLGNSVDIEFLRNSPFSLHRYFDPSYQQGQIGKVQFIESSHGFWDATLENSGQLDFPPQFALHPGGWVLLAKGPDQTFAAQILDRVRTAEPHSIHRNIRDVPEHVPARIVVRGKTLLLRARSAGEAEQLLALAKGPLAHEDGHPFEPLAMPEKMNIRLSIDPNIVGRCIAKMAFNMAAAVFGARPLLHEAFNPVRAYILGDDVLDGPTVGADGEPGVTIDHRYVEPWMGRPPQAPKTATTVHTVELVKRRGGLGAFVSLFGASEWFAVRLGPLEGLDPSRLGSRLLHRDDDDYWELRSVWTSWNKMRAKQTTPAAVLDMMCAGDGVDANSTKEPVAGSGGRLRDG